MPDFLPDRLEAGTQNIPGAAGLLAGLRQLRREGTAPRLEREKQLCGLLKEELQNIPGVRTFTGKSQAGVLSFTVEGVDSILLGEALSRRGIAQRAGLHCAPLAHETAGTIETGTIRLSPGPNNTPEEIVLCSTALRACLRERDFAPAPFV